MHIYGGMCIECEGQQDSANSEDGKCFTVSSFVFLNSEYGMFHPSKRINNFFNHKVILSAYKLCLLWNLQA